MIGKIQTLSPVSKGADSNGWVGRIAQQLDVVKDILGNLEVGVGLDMTSDANGRVKIELTAPVGGGTMAGLNNSAFVATAEIPTGGSAYTVKMLGGTVQGVFGAIRVIPTSTWTGIADGRYFWLQFNGTTWEVNNSSTLPQAASVAAGDNVNYFAVIPLFKVETGAPNNVIQYHYGSVYVPTVTNVVQVQ